MYCSNCGEPLNENQAVCLKCGVSVNQRGGAGAYAQRAVYPGFNEMNLPEQYRPLGAWAYFGYTLLFCIPIVGFIMLIVFSFSDTNINRRNFARSYWCVVALALIICGILLAFGLTLWGVDSASKTVSTGTYRYR